jgi:hypothetical protein
MALWITWNVVAGRLRNEVFNAGLESRACTLLRHYPQPSIVIAGDSRGLYNINTRMLSRITGKTAINCAMEFCDISTAANLINKYQELNSARIIILAASVYQINDNIIDFGCFSASAFFRTSFPDQIRLFWDHPFWLADRYRTAKALYKRTVYSGGLFTCKDRDYLSLQYINDMGYRSRDEIWDKKIKEDISWYKNFSENGPKARIFKEAVNSIENTGAKVILVIPPVSSAWKHVPEVAHAIDIERKFIAFCRYAADNRASVISFFDEPDSVFPDSFFLDPLHLNKYGAAKLTAMLADSL